MFILEPYHKIYFYGILAFEDINFLPEVVVRYEIHCNADFPEKNRTVVNFYAALCKFCPDRKTALQRIRIDRDRTVGILTVIFTEKFFHYKVKIHF